MILAQDIGSLVLINFRSNFEGRRGLHHREIFPVGSCDNTLSGGIFLHLRVHHEEVTRIFSSTPNFA